MRRTVSAPSAWCRFGLFTLLLAFMWPLRGVQPTSSQELITWLVVTQPASGADGSTLARRAHGTLVREVSAIGVYTIQADEDAGTRLAADPTLGVARVSDDDVRALDSSFVTTRTPGDWFRLADVLFTSRATAFTVLEDDLFSAAQWGLSAIHAREAWAATGHRGKGVRVAVLDTGIDPTHPDLAVNVNVALATSFVPGQTWDVSTDTTAHFDHGTHVAGIIGAADNGLGIIGVAPDVELVPVQVLGRPTGTGPPDAVIAGIVYAADIGADVINLSLAYTRGRHGGVNTLGTEDPSDDVPYTAAEAAALATAFARATEYAHRRGATIVTGTHNNSIDGNHDRDLILLPRDAPHVLTVAATGPLGWAIDPAVDLDTPAFYTNYGTSVVDVSAPGGNLDFNLLASGAFCAVSSGSFSITLPCWVFDGVLSTAPVKIAPYPYEFRLGTSMASAHVSGAAALVIGSSGGAMNPDHVKARLRAAADDLGAPGKDAFYGLGRINALSAVLEEQR